MILPVAWPSMLLSHALVTSLNANLESIKVFSLPSLCRPTKNSRSSLVSDTSIGTSCFLEKVNLCRAHRRIAEKLGVRSITFPESLSTGSNMDQLIPTVQWTTPSYFFPEGLFRLAPSGVL
ncbi:hypothetical protein PR202_gb26065 [Eleusine coracana subsp. coracana]|uniref:Uncharacterized protein n=1 Tax=Eleusine coracana subsp. coracana TaxID=191504 RepID=A0AAV5FSA4_ELECO|nr:hypothetical protein PR202_gb26065 [Eleusine coracana subsp. coracana]